ncbi:MAG: hypothetical protein ABL977_08105 [Candidatus Eisenbacteria bacterium]
MRFNRMAVAVSVLAVLFAALVLNVVTAFASPVWVVKQLKWRDTLGQAVANLPADTTFMTDELDTTRTYPIDTSDWDWAALAGTATTSGANNAKIMFVSSTNTSNGVTDSLYYEVEKGTGADSLYSLNTTFSGAANRCAVNEAGTAMGNVWVGSLLVDVDTPAASNIWLCPSFRLRVAGDVGGATPKVSGLKAYIIYPRRQEAQ